MGKISDTVLILRSLQNLKELNEKVKAVINSNLTDEEKVKAIQSYKKFKKVTVLFVICICLVIAIGVIYSSISKFSDTSIALLIGLIILAIIASVLYNLLSKKIFYDWNKYSTIVEYGWDGLSKEEIEKLKPSLNDNEAIEKYKKNDIIAGVLLIVSLIVEFSILFNFGFEVYSPLTMIITFIIVIVWFIFHDNYEVEIHRLKSGYYKKSYGFKCSHCHTPVSIKFEEVEKYESLPKNENGIRVMKCPKCNNDVQFVNFDNELADYNKFKIQNK